MKAAGAVVQEHLLVGIPGMNLICETHCHFSLLKGNLHRNAGETGRVQKRVNRIPAQVRSDARIGGQEFREGFAI